MYFAQRLGLIFYCRPVKYLGMAGGLLKTLINKKNQYNFSKQKFISLTQLVSLCLHSNSKADSKIYPDFHTIFINYCLSADNR